jgi:antitoxin component of RelBE/YafQ-DinJ toxin-antitoxin module
MKNVRINDNLHYRLKVVAANMGCTMAEVIDLALVALKSEKEKTK